MCVCVCVRACMRTCKCACVRMCMCACVCVWTELEVCTMFVGISTYQSPIKENRGKKVRKTKTDPKSTPFFVFFQKCCSTWLGSWGAGGGGPDTKEEHT